MVNLRQSPENMKILFMGTEEEFTRAYRQEAGFDLPPVFFFTEFPMGIIGPVLAPINRLILEQETPWPLPVFAFGPSNLIKEAFDLGCHDYLIEPWTASELVARIDKRFDRVELSPGLVFMPNVSILEGDVRTVRLSGNCSGILTVLLANKNCFVKKRDLAIICGYEGIDSRALDMSVCRLRKGMALASSRPDTPLIQTGRSSYRILCQ